MSEPSTTTQPTNDAPSGSSSGGGGEYRIELDAYAGPLDLLLYLVKRHEIDLEDIPIAKLTDQYMQHLHLIREINVEQASEFLVMAATLLEIKSRTLMPRGKRSDDDSDESPPSHESALGQEGSEPFDPRSELVQQLLAYKKYKDAAIALEHRQAQWSGRFQAHADQGTAEQFAPASDPANQADEDEGQATASETDTDAQATEAAATAKPVELDIEDVHVLDLCQAFSRLLESIGERGDHEVTYDETPVSLHAEDIADRLQRDTADGRMTLHEIFADRTGKSEMIGLFLALLELVRQRRVHVYQEQFTDELAPQIVIERRSDAEREAQAQAERDEEDALDQWRDPDSGEMVYDWPDEQSRKRYERRQQRARAASESTSTDAE